MDALRPRTLCFISHAHSDHISVHARTIATKATAVLCRARLATRAATDYEVREFGESFECGDAHLTLLPAGHVLGSSQIAVRTEHTVTVYTGDFKLRAGRTHEPCEVPRCDTLVMECTYGRPHYRFPQRRVVEEQLVQRCSAALSRGITPVVYAYALGKAQEVIAALRAAGLPVMAFGAVARMCQVYESLGVSVGGYDEQGAEGSRRCVVVAPPSLRRTRELAALAPIYEIAVTGWAVDARARLRLGVDCALPLSDHADFDELLAYVRRAQPKQVYCLHGFPDFVHHLRRAGVKARWFEPNRQLALF